VAQEGYDRLMALTDSRYRLSMIVARRAAQLKGGIPTTLDSDEMPAARQNTVSVAMREFELGREVRWGDELPTFDELKRTVVEERGARNPASRSRASASRATTRTDPRGWRGLGPVRGAGPPWPRARVAAGRPGPSDAAMVYHACICRVKSTASA
jgi:DNA-directed RNA polymerase subunit omega